MSYLDTTQQPMKCKVLSFLIDVIMCGSAHKHLSHVPNTDTLDIEWAETDIGAFVWTQAKQIARRQGKCATSSFNVWRWHAGKRNGTVGCWSWVGGMISLSCKRCKHISQWYYFSHISVATVNCVDFAAVGCAENLECVFTMLNLRLVWISGPVHFWERCYFCFKLLKCQVGTRIIHESMIPCPS